MKYSRKPIFAWLLFSGIILVITLIMQPLEVYLFAKYIPVLFPKGMIALKERNLLFLIQLIMLVFVIPVYLFTFIFSWWYRADNKKSTYDPHLVDHKVAEFFWWGVPFVMTVVVCVITWFKTHELDPYRPIQSEKEPIDIEVVALQWKWLFLYPEENIASVNYVHIPKDTPVHFHITADAPMNALWIPRLAGMIYAMPGMRTELHLIANAEGEFRGSSAQISGKGFSGMTFVTKASSEESYKNWMQSARQSTKSLDKESYRKLAEPSENHPVEFYRLTEKNLFQDIIMKYTKPEK
ncbi:MAG: COX aromatic rich motif-containing protein [Waddliaceae bacterium]